MLPFGCTLVSIIFALVRHPPTPMPSMNLQLSDEQATALERELRRIIDDDRYPLSPRMKVAIDVF